jgi:hypothetical protein
VQAQKEKQQQQKQKTSKPAPKAKKRKPARAAEHDPLRAEMLATADQILAVYNDNGDNSKDNASENDEGGDKQAQNIELPDNGASAEQHESAADSEIASESADEHAEDGAQDHGEELGHAAPQPKVAATDRSPEQPTPPPPAPPAFPMKQKPKHVPTPKQSSERATDVASLPKLEPTNLAPVLTPLEMMNAVVDAAAFTGTVERLRATASEAWADIFEVRAGGGGNLFVAS